MSTICPRFAQNAWKKDLCSNCFKSKEEHKNLQNEQKPIKIPMAKQLLTTEPTKSIMKSTTTTTKETKRLLSKKTKVSFPKELSQVIGFGGNWSDIEQSDSDSDIEQSINNSITSSLSISSSPSSSSSSSSSMSSQSSEEISKEIDELEQELVKLTKVNTNYNQSNGNLLGDVEANIKRSFAALQLGSQQKDNDGKKQTLKISVMPFGGPVTTNKVNDIKQKFNGPNSTNLSDDCLPKPPVVLKTIIKSTGVEYIEEPINKDMKLLSLSSSTSSLSSSPTISSSMIEKSLMDEISETLERKNKEKQQENKIKLEVHSKRSLTRNAPIIKDQIKPKISIFPKSSDTDSNQSDTENSSSGYYDVVEASSRYENLSDDYTNINNNNNSRRGSQEHLDDDVTLEIRNKNESSFFSNHLISEMFSTNNDRKNGRSYSFMSEVTSDGLIVTKASSDDAMDSTGSSFDYATSSDEELSSMNRSESDSGIGICVTTTTTATKTSSSTPLMGGGTSGGSNNDYVNVEKLRTMTSNDYEDVQVQGKSDNQRFFVNKSRELAGEPDGRADPDGGNEAPALPLSPPPNVNNNATSLSTNGNSTSGISPTTESRISFLHQNSGKNNEKPAVPVKPTVSIIKAFVKRQPNSPEQQVISELQNFMKHSTETKTKIKSSNKIIEQQSESSSSSINSTPITTTKAAMKKTRAPEPPSPTLSELEIDLMNKNNINNSNNNYEDVNNTNKFEEINLESEICEVKINKPDEAIKQSPPVLKHHEQHRKSCDDQYNFLYTRNPTGSVSKSTSPVIREKDKRERATINPKFRSLNTFSTQYKNQLAEKMMRSSTPEPAPRKSLSLSQDSLVDDKKKKTKFSIKKFLRISTNKSSEQTIDKKDTGGTYGKRSQIEDNEIPQVKPRLVIIHPIDINNMEVEVVKEMGKVSEIVTGKPPAPPLRKGLDLNKPNRPPPPKSAEVRKKLKLGIIETNNGINNMNNGTINSTLNGINGNSSIRSKEDNVYANLGEIRSAIAPRKPERTASMREREAQIEQARKRLSKLNNADGDDDIDISPISSPSSISTPSTLERTEPIYKLHEINQQQSTIIHQQQQLHDTGISTITKDNNNKFSSRLELFEKTISEQNNKSQPIKHSFLSDGIKNSMQKMNNTIDNYLKDKLAESSTVLTTPQQQQHQQQQPSQISTTNSSPSSQSIINGSIKSVRHSSGGGGGVSNIVNGVVNGDVQDVSRNSTYEPIIVNTQRSSLPDSSMNVYHQNMTVGSPAMIRSGYAKSDIGATGRHLSQSMANIVRAVSRSYCGSEVSELDIYSPYSFYGGSEAGTDMTQSDLNDSGWNGHQMTKTRSTNRLRMRKGRSIVHKNLEDNYGAVVVANHESLAQVLDQLQKTITISPLLRPLANSINLRFDDFAILEGVRGVVAGRRAFHPAVWANQIHVTLALSCDCNQMTDLNPITEFCDLVPSHYLPLVPNLEVRLVQSTISVLPRMFVDTLQSFGQMLRIRSENLKNQSFGGSTMNLSTTGDTQSLRTGQSVQNLSTFQENNTEFENSTSSNILSESVSTTNLPQIPGMPSYDEILCREVGFVLLQLVNGLKNVQAKGIEELPLSLSNVILCKDLENKESQAKLFVLHGLNQDMAREDEETMGTLCQCAHSALTSMLPQTKLTPILTNILLKDRSESLSKTKSLLEFSLWGPSDVALNGSIKERELALQRWLDLERATILHGLVRARVELSSYDECHLMFLVRSSAKIICEAASILSGFSDILE